MRLTTRAGGALEGDYHAGTRRLVYASRRTGDAEIWIQEDAPDGLSVPRRLASHSSRDRMPAIGPRGRRVAFNSARQDVSGDIYVADLGRGLTETILEIGSIGGRLPLVPRRSDVRRLTRRGTAEGGLCWHPDGTRLFYASRGATDDDYEIYSIPAEGGTPRKITSGGAQMPACSPDGRWLAFSSRRDGSPHIYVRRLDSPDETGVVRLTSGEGMDVSPAWSFDGRRILFERYSRDTDGDGRLGERDTPSIYAITFRESVVLEGQGPFPPRQLTSGRYRDTSPRGLSDGFLFVSDRGKTGAGREEVNLWAFPDEGEGPDAERVSEYLESARRRSRVDRSRRWQRLLVWQNACWAIREARAGGSVRMDLGTTGEAAEAPVGMAMVLAELGYIGEAISLLSEVIDQYAADNSWVKLARIREMELRHRQMQSERDPNWEKHLERVKPLVQELVPEENAIGPGSDRVRFAAALGQLELARTLAPLKQSDRALRILDEVTREYPEHGEACTRALLEMARIFQSFGQWEAAIDSLVRLLRGWSDAEPWSSEAARELVRQSLREAGSAMPDRISSLRRIVEQHGRVPVLPALAMNRIGDLHHRAGKLEHARESYRRTIENYPESPRQVIAAHLALGEVHLEQRDFEAAMMTFHALRTAVEQAGEWSRYRGAERGYIRAAVQKGRAELAKGDPGLARSTFERLVEFEPDLPVAHRGIVDALWSLEQLDTAIRRYRNFLRDEPRNDVARYALARAYSYYGPQQWKLSGEKGRRVALDRRALKLVDRATAARPDVAYYHQLRGFLLNRIAVATDAQEMKVRALDAYLRALGVSDRDMDRKNHANLLFNVGEGYMLVDQPGNAHEYYRRAMDAGFDFTGRRGEVALRNVSRAAMDAGEYEIARGLLKRALERVGDPLPEDRTRRIEILIQRVRVQDHLALVNYLDEKYKEAARLYGQSVATIERLMEADPDNRAAYGPNLVRALRNQAVNIFHAVEKRSLESAELERCWGLLREALAMLERYGGMRDERDSAPGLITVDVRVTLGEGPAAGTFDRPAEKRLIYTYMARIRSLSGDHAEAAMLLGKKVNLYPKFDPQERPGRATEVSVVLSQLADHRRVSSDLFGAAAALERALRLERAAGNLEGAMSTCFSLGRLGVRLGETGGEERPAADEDFRMLIKRIIVAHRQLIARSSERDQGDLAGPITKLQRNLSDLSVLVPEETIE